jgi:zona occludens toxin
MLTLITGAPRTGKSLYGVWELARKVPGSTITVGKQEKPRRLLSNIEDLLLEHEKIGASEMNNWHEWAQAADVIIFDEIQEIWRPRSIGTKVPEQIAALEIHGHKGIDIILITQHPMLLDQNVRRLVNQHIHVRRMGKSAAMIYEWDHCSDPGRIKAAMNSKFWWYPKDAFSLYKSADAHTKTTAKMPRIFWVGVAALVVSVVAIPLVIKRISGNFDGSVAIAKGQAQTLTASISPASPGSAPLPAAGASAPAFAGCVVKAGECRCYDSAGDVHPVRPSHCDASTKVAGNFDLRHLDSYVKPPAPEPDDSMNFVPGTRNLLLERKFASFQ